jgi:hypothetical protein
LGAVIRDHCLALKSVVALLNERRGDEAAQKLDHAVSALLAYYERKA